MLTGRPRSDSRSPRRSIVVSVGGRTDDEAAQQLTRSLCALGVDSRYFGHRDNAQEIAALVADERADTVELCLAGGARGVLLLRQLLRGLIDVGRRDVTIVVHRVR
jgi:methylmalonyl-CoA mutase cobalamin-binding subunit